MSQLERFLDGQTERNIEEESRKNKYPQTCSEQCPNHQCPYHNVDHYGKACEAQWEPKENKNMKQPNTNLERKLEIAIAKAMKPTLDRLEALEAGDRTPTNRMLNGSKIPLTNYRGTNQENLSYD